MNNKRIINNKFKHDPMCIYIWSVPSRDDHMTLESSYLIGGLKMKYFEEIKVLFAGY